jgi:hypothetical protein
LDLKLLLKRGALISAANWPVVAIQFAAQTTFKVLLAVPTLGAAVLVTVLVDADLVTLVQLSTRDSVASIADALAAHAAAGPIEREPITAARLQAASAFSLERFANGCQRWFARYVILGLALFVVYGLSGAGYLGLGVVAYRDGGSVIALAALGSVLFVLWITCVNLIYLVLQIAIAMEDVGVGRAARRVIGFIRAEYRQLGGVFLVVLAMVVAATVASMLAWSGVGLIAFVPLVGLAVIPLQLVGLLLQGLLFEYIGLTALGAYATLYRRFIYAELTAAAAMGSDWEAVRSAPPSARSAS